MAQILLEKPVLKKHAVVQDYTIIKPYVKVPVGYTKLCDVKLKKKLSIPEKSQKKLAEKTKFNAKVFEEMISIKEVRRNIHFRNYGVY